MSAILLTLGKDFAVLCGETMFNLDDGRKGRIEKVNMVQNKFIYGFTGRNVPHITQKLK